MLLERIEELFPHFDPEVLLEQFLQGSVYFISWVVGLSILQMVIVVGSTISGRVSGKPLGEVIAKGIRKVPFWAVLTISLYASLISIRFDEWSAGVWMGIQLIFFFLFYIIIAGTVNNIILSITRLTTRDIRSKKAGNYYLYISLVIRTAVWLFGLIFVLGFLGIDASGLIAALGISGFALAFAFRNLIKDILGSFLIVFESPLRVGDYVLVDKYHGSIRKIGFLRTSIRTSDGHEVVIPNSKIVDNAFTNYRSGTSRILKFSIVVTSPKMFPEGFDEIVMEQVEENKRDSLITDIQWHVESYSEKEVTVVCFVKVTDIDSNTIDKISNEISQYLLDAATKMFKKGVTIKQDLEAIRDLA